MSRCYYLDHKGSIDLDAVLKIAQKMVQEIINESFTVQLEKYQPSDEEGGCFYIEGQSARGVQFFYEDKNIVVKINTLSNYADYILAKIILLMLSIALEEEIIDEEDFHIEADEYFTDENIQKLREDEAKTVLTVLKTAVKDTLQFPCVVRKVYFGKKLTQKLEKYENNPKMLVKTFDSIIHHVQYEIPDYNMPGAMLIRPKNSEDKKDAKKVRMMFEGNSYILQDYDYLSIGPDEKNGDFLLIDFADVSEIAAKIFSKNPEFEFADDFTIVFPKLEGDSWKKFVDMAREKHHKEIVDIKPAAETVDLTPDDNSENEKEDEHSNQCHGSHWGCVAETTEKALHELLVASLEEGSLYGETECDYNVEEKFHGKTAVLEFDGKNPDSAIVIRSLIVETKDGTKQFASAYPVVKSGTVISLKIEEIEEWENRLEAWITGELADGRLLTFFDADYALNKNNYENGKTLDFMIGALAYFAGEPETKGFTFEGQKAIDFKAKMREEPEYDENGNVKPIHFSTENLCALLQTGNPPDDAEFISTVEDVKTVETLGNSFWKFHILYRDGEDNEEKIPAYVLKTKENRSLDKAAQIQGVVWLTGYMVK